MKRYFKKEFKVEESVLNQIEGITSEYRNTDKPQWINTDYLKAKALSTFVFRKLIRS